MEAKNMTEAQTGGGPPPRDLTEDLWINKVDLPGEWERQPQLFMYWAEEYAYAILTRDREKDQVELILADLDGAIRADPDAYGLKKVTDASVSAAAKRTQTYIDGQERLHQANLVVNRMAAARSAMDHKRKALDNLTSLALADFYGSNTAPAESRVAHSKKGQDRFAEHQAEKAAQKAPGGRTLV